MKKKTNLFSKLFFLFQRKPVIVVIGDRRKRVKKKTLIILKKYFHKEKDFFIFTANQKNIDQVSFFLKHSKNPILVSTSMKAIRKNIQKNIAQLSYKTKLILNSDDPITPRLEKIGNSKIQKYGFSNKSDLYVSEQKNGFKVQYNGSIVPIPLQNKSKKNIYSTLASIAIALNLGLNLVEISQAFKKD
jgi:hypothetical protein